MKSLLKTIIVLSFLLPAKAGAQCPVAGSDSSVTYCPNEPFDVSTLLSADADSGGVFLSPFGDTINPPLDTLSILGVYNYRYIVSDSACENDTAIFQITIYCFMGGTHEFLEASRIVAYPNPAIDHLELISTDADELLIYDGHGKCVFRQTAPLTSAINISQLDPGLYLLILQQDGTGTFQRFLKVEAP